MMQRFVFAVIFVITAGLFSCYDDGGTRSIDDAPDPLDEDSGIIIGEDSLADYGILANETQAAVPKWKEPTHRNIASIAAMALGLTPERAAIIRRAADMPDTFQSGLQGGFNQQWSHAFIYNSWGWHVWGDADDDFHDTIDGDSGESESPEGYNGRSAGYYYRIGKRDLGDWYTGYALHYVMDVSLLLHTSIPDAAKLLHHFDYELWIDNNWSDGHHFEAFVASVSPSSYYAVTNLKSVIRGAAKKSCTALNANAKRAWNSYKASGYPTGAGSGSADAVYYAKRMLAEAVKYSGGTIRYTLDKYNQW